MSSPAVVVAVPAVANGGASALVLDQVSKRFGRNKALDGLSFSVPAGSICGLVGENGAGKTTCLSVIGGFLDADQGSVNVLGQGPFSVSTHRGRVGILPQDAELPEENTPSELLYTWARLQGLGPGPAREAASRALAEVNLMDRAKSPVKALSHGMRRRLTVASALLGNPELVLLDEPTAGLDPAQARSLREVLSGLRGRTTVLVSSHNLPELESICDHVVIIEKGRCVRDDRMDVVTGRAHEVSVHLAEPLPPGREAVVRLAVAPGEQRDLATLTSALLRELLAEGALISEVRRGSALEERYFGER